MDLRVDPGTMMAAWPDLLDPNFMHSVILMCQHSDEGAYGLVVNRPSKLTVDALLPEHPLLSKSEFPVYVGGPVDPTVLQYVHRVPDEVPGGFPLSEELWLGGDLDRLGEFVLQEPERAASAVRFLIGYSGWGEGQLDAELAQGSWIPAPLSLEALFSIDPEGAWRRVVRSIGEGGPGLESLPPDIRWN